MTIRYKPDWPETQRRLTALWHGERLDRPCINLRAPQPLDEPLPVPPPANDEARWLDPGHVIPSALNAVRGTWWGGETIPGYHLMANWVNCLGGTPRFSPETIWFETRPVAFTQPSPFRHDPDNPWTRKYLNLIAALCQAAGRDDFFVAAAAGLPANDLLSMVMGTEAFLFALNDHPDWMREAILAGARDRLALVTALAEFKRRCGHALTNGMTGWMPFWAPEPVSGFQSDVSCMLSPAMFDRFVVPEMELASAAGGAIWYHLDGGDALQHLPRLLSLPFLRVLQYTPAPCEPPNGPAHVEMYKRAQAAGKIVHIELPPPNIEPLVRELDPARLMLQAWCSSRAEGEQLLDRMVRWTAANTWKGR
ncbi:MAG: hypothetical protein BWZ02_03088 [Lentisphaerae bacterium ADurb.BinA184]|nr:MAG: hypothetical protein BWZ02_03088 [Lentisphaerae bacterium ADurb.BinA184]